MASNGYLRTVRVGGFDKQDVLAYVDDLTSKIYNLENKVKDQEETIERLEDDEIWKDYQVTAWQGGINDSKHLRWFSAFIDTIKKRHEGATLAERIQKYVIWLGFTEKDMERFRNFMFEDI